MIDRVWQITARSPQDLYTDDWRTRMMTLLGYRPRRISLFTESVLYGAFNCLSQMDDFDQKDLGQICLTTRRGAYSATLKAVHESQSELPLPFTFLQSQMSQALVALVSALKWQGDARIIITGELADYISLALLQSSHGSLLLGCAEEMHDVSADGENQWLYLKRCEMPSDLEFKPINWPDHTIEYVKLSDRGLSGA